ncbi:hypothetical protein EDC01DRAFT_635184 [Geopyxis carbonaria]|nr:hypothetical protein EDC01DRAFT_635184 [Geopyxis carbonaria]
MTRTILTFASFGCLKFDSCHTIQKHHIHPICASVTLDLCFLPLHANNILQLLHNYFLMAKPQQSHQKTASIEMDPFTNTDLNHRVSTDLDFVPGSPTQVSVSPIRAVDQSSSPSSRLPSAMVPVVVVSGARVAGIGHATHHDNDSSSTFGRPNYYPPGQKPYRTHVGTVQEDPTSGNADDSQQNGNEHCKASSCFCGGGCVAS